ncbi:hypothetical protein JL720_15208 [Aureococcus anophagefferens]|nr:hypothetical protein JL720_15208 [Aureococcus anophagefferens]
MEISSCAPDLRPSSSPSATPSASPTLAPTASFLRITSIGSGSTCVSGVECEVLWVYRGDPGACATVDVEVSAADGTVVRAETTENDGQQMKVVSGDAEVNEYTLTLTCSDDARLADSIEFEVSFTPAPRPADARADACSIDPVSLSDAQAEQHADELGTVRRPSAGPSPMPSLSCAAGASVYRVRLSGSRATLVIESLDDGAVVATTTLEDEEVSATQFVCLPDSCYESDDDDETAPEVDTSRSEQSFLDTPGRLPTDSRFAAMDDNDESRSVTMNPGGTEAQRFTFDAVFEGDEEGLRTTFCKQLVDAGRGLFISAGSPPPVDTVAWFASQCPAPVTASVLEIRHEATWDAGADPVSFF